MLPGGSGLQGQYNYVRDSVKAVVNAYTGAVNFYVVDSTDPVLLAWEHAFPGMFKPLSDMGKLSPQLLNHLRYPQDLLTVLSSMYGRYHFGTTSSQASQFYTLQNAWSIASATSQQPYVPVYELLRLPDQNSLSFVAIEPLVPQSSSGKSQLLAGFITANSDNPGYGSLTAYELPSVTPNALGPALVAAKIQAVQSVAQQTTLLDQRGSKVLLGPTLLVPIEDSLIYVQTLYATSTSQRLPALDFVATDFGGDKVGFAPTLIGSLQQLFGGTVNVGTTTSQSLSQQIEEDLDLAYAAYKQSTVDLKASRLGDFQHDIQQMGQYLNEAHQLLAAEHKKGSSGSPSSGSGSGSGSSGSSTTTPTSSVPASSGTTPSKSSSKSSASFG